VHTAVLGGAAVSFERDTHVSLPILGHAHVSGRVEVVVTEESTISLVCVAGHVLGTPLSSRKKCLKGHFAKFNSPTNRQLFLSYY